MPMSGISRCRQSPSVNVRTFCTGALYFATHSASHSEVERFNRVGQMEYEQPTSDAPEETSQGSGLEIAQQNAALTLAVDSLEEDTLHAFHGLSKLNDG